MPRSKGRSGRPWNRIRQQVLAEEPQCAWCSRHIDPALRFPHRLSGTVDHVVELISGGDPIARENLTAMHLVCNLQKENARRRRTEPKSRRW